MATDAFPDKEFSKNCYTHVIEKLVVLAKLDDALKTAMDADPDLRANWGVAPGWSEEKRYHRIDKAEAKRSTPPSPTAAHGVLPWIKTQW